MSVLTASIAAILLPAPAAVQADEPPCGGTVLQLSVAEQSTTPAVRFRFSLALMAEGASEKVALQQLQKRLQGLRLTLEPLVVGTLTVPAPSTYQRGSQVDAERRYTASTGVSGDVKRSNYNALIEAVGGMAGVRLQGMTSQADPGDAELVQQRLTVAALRRGTAEAEAMAAAIGVSRVRLLRINRPDAMVRPRAIPLETARSGFRPGEAPKPAQTLRLQLDYCLSDGSEGKGLVGVA
ncbi:hypothetical protein KR100_02440 [Synechococcus sp. KORDI-100]|uniref:SIMPL domain-containing protein n=1 Tax=Synechococcus sp. KORDI-100 TaxID=1280380 RepID=UPI0004E03672|nr:SIMPL domain-containing protein [Synechococcus sp. KORDI-100]AII42263.1 hypothetical protein KR100_02440 [Synechococcus sp. KORDI-100]